MSEITSAVPPVDRQPYLFGSRILTHTLFWLCYFLFFGFIWAEAGNYRISYFLEFVLLPTRMLAAYVSLYVLLPRFLAVGKNLRFIGYYLLLLAVCGLLQRILTYFFFEWVTLDNTIPLISFHYWLRAIILINSTVLFLLAVKIVLSWQQDRRKLQQFDQDVQLPTTIELRSDGRNYKISLQDILYIEALGNYVTVHLPDQKIISYHSLRDMQSELPEYFLRVHRSYIVNSRQINSYNTDDIDIQGHLIPIGRSYKAVVEQL